MFSSPSPYGEMKPNSEKEYRLISYPTSKLSSPYDGVVIEPLNPPCENYIQIRHNVNDRMFDSLFCGVGNRTVSHGDKVRKGQSIGNFGEDKIMFYVLDSLSGKKVSIERFYQEPVTSKVDDKKENEEKKKEVEKKKEENKKKNKVKNKSNGEGSPETVFLDMLLLPFSALNAATNKVSDIKKDNEEKKDKLQEQISRIKKML